jgi:hypothetical protein
MGLVRRGRRPTREIPGPVALAFVPTTWIGGAGPRVMRPRAFSQEWFLVLSHISCWSLLLVRRGRRVRDLATAQLLVSSHPSPTRRTAPPGALARPAPWPAGAPLRSSATAHPARPPRPPPRLPPVPAAGDPWQGLLPSPRHEATPLTGRTPRCTPHGGIFRARPRDHEGSVHLSDTDPSPRTNPSRKHAPAPGEISP